MDLISRQAALDALDKRFDSIPMEQTTEILLLRKDLRDLPSAQPEIIRCKDCKHRGETPIADGRYWCDIHDTFMYYCSDAERRTDG